MFGLSDAEIHQIKNLIHSNGSTLALLFGSRAKGNYKAGSDVDIAVNSNETKISYILNEESNLPYYFDIVNIKKIKNKKLLDHIDTIGKSF